MKKALTKDARILDVVAEEFPVHPDLIWVDVPDDTTTRDTYVAGAVAKEPAPTPAQVKEWMNAPILALIAAADLKIIRAMTEGDTPRIVAHRAAQALLRAKLT